MSAAIVVLDGAVADLAPRPPPVALALPSGVHALVGSEADGTVAIAALVTGTARRRAGQVRVGDADPARDPATRARVAAVLREPRLPATGTVAELLAAAAAWRGGSPREVLAALGHAPLAARRTAGLDRAEARAVELAIALATPAPLALVVAEPGAVFTGVDLGAARERLADAAARGACVLLVGSSPAEAAELAPEVHLLDRGRVARTVLARDAIALAQGRGLELRVRVSEPRALVAGLAAEPAVLSVAWDAERDPGVVAVRGPDLDAVAVAVARAAARAGAVVHAIAPVVPGLDEVRAAASGAALAAWHAAWRAGAAGPTAPPGGPR